MIMKRGLFAFVAAALVSALLGGCLFLQREPDLEELQQSIVQSRPKIESCSAALNLSGFNTNLSLYIHVTGEEVDEELFRQS